MDAISRPAAEPCTVVRPIGVRGLELWDAAVDGRTLHDWRWDSSFGRRLATVVRGLGLDPATAVVLVGGGAEPSLLATLCAAGLRASIAADPIFAAARAGSARRLVAADLCVDLGQTSLKLCDGDRAWRVERDLARAPRRDTIGSASLDDARARTLAFLAAAIREPTRPRRVLLAVPAELVEPGWPRACSYAWPDPDPRFAHELATAIGIAREDLWLVNDAELAAVAVAQQLPRRRSCATLVLTVGFGVGAALLEATP